MKSLAMMLGRWLLCGIFLYFAVDKLQHWESTSSMLALRGIQMVPVVLSTVVVIELVGSLALFLGSWTRFSAMILALYLIPVTILFHDFWTLDGVALYAELEIFLRNCAIIGGLLYVFATGPGKFSRDYSIVRKRKKEEALYEELEN